MEQICKTTSVCSARCGVCIEAGPSPSQSSSEPQMSAWLRNVPAFSLLTLLCFHCLLRPAEARQLRWCDVETFNESLSTFHEGVYGLVNIREPKTRRMAGHAAQQHVLLECPGICQVADDQGVHCCTALRLLPTRTPSRRVASMMHVPFASSL